MRPILMLTCLLVLPLCQCVVPKYEIDETMVDSGTPEEDAAVEAEASTGCEGLAPAPQNCGATGQFNDEMEPFPGGYCIDSFEVLTADYGLWQEVLQGNLGTIALGLLPKSCAGKGSFSPLNPSLTEEQPVVFVDWCDAWAYCHTLGKHLCGNIGQEAGREQVPPLEQNNCERDEWYNACTEGGTFNFSVEGDEDCNTGTGSLASVDETYCELPNYEVYDLSGNVAEWENACQDDSPTAFCRIRGGSFFAQESDFSCEAAGLAVRRDTTDHTGFRCCWHPNDRVPLWTYGD